MKSAIIRRLYGSSTATTNDLCHLDVPFDAWLVGIDIEQSAVNGAIGDRVRFEVSTASVCQATTNDALGCLANSVCGLFYATNGGNAVLALKWCGPLQIFIPRGTRIYGHTIQAGTTATVCLANLHLVPA